MAEIRQTELDVDVIPRVIEQKFATATALTGVAPTLSSEPAGERDFVPFVSDVDGVTRMKNPGPTTAEGTLDEADDGGLFELDHEAPVRLEHVVANLSSSVAWTIAVVTANGLEYIVAAGTGSAVLETPNITLMPGEHVQVTAGAPTGKPWVRIYVRSS